MHKQLTARLFNNRLSLSTGVSLLLHLLVFFSFSFLILKNTPTPKKTRVDIFEVRFSQRTPPQAQPKPSNQILASSKPAPFKVAQADIKKTTEPPLSVPVVEQPSPPAEAVEGVAFISAIATPFQGHARSNNPFSLHARAAQQDAAQTYYQQAMEAQARQRSEMQAQLMIQQLQQMLVKRLDVKPLVTGKCILVESDSGVNSRLKCDSSALYEVLYKDLKDVAEMLIALRGMGRMFNGFTTEIQKDKPAITLISEALSTNSNKETLQPPLP